MTWFCSMDHFWSNARYDFFFCSPGIIIIKALTQGKHLTFKVIFERDS